MENEKLYKYLEIKDTCRYGLIKYLADALEQLPEINSPKILDIGCGTGVTTLFMADIFNGIIHGIDTNAKSISHLKNKIIKKKLSGKVFTEVISVLNLEFESNLFDIILAEGLLNIIGFEKGLSIAKKYLKINGYFIIHDELKNHNEKIKIFEKHYFKLIDYFELGEDIWWNDYYSCLEIQINSCKDEALRDLFKNDLGEIQMYKKDPSNFISVYYILQNS